jgi:hypothetical protein
MNLLGSWETCRAYVSQNWPTTSNNFFWRGGIIQSFEIIKMRTTLFKDLLIARAGSIIRKTKELSRYPDYWPPQYISQSVLLPSGGKKEC